MRLLPLALATSGLVLAAAPTAQAGSLVTFASPSKNIGCYLDATTVRCDINKRDWTPPATPTSCEYEYGNGAQVGARSSRGTLVCASDTALPGTGSGTRILKYGASLTRGKITCRSAASGITCKNGKGHGFRLSRQSYRLF